MNFDSRTSAAVLFCSVCVRCRLHVTRREGDAGKDGGVWMLGCLCLCLPLFLRVVVVVVARARARDGEERRGDVMWGDGET